MKSTFIFVLFFIMAWFLAIASGASYHALEGDWKLISIFISGFYVCLILILFRGVELMGL